MIRHLYLFLLLIVSVSPVVHAQSFDRPKLDSFFNALSANERTMGSFTLAKNDKVLFTRTVGYERVDGDKKIPATALTRYRIGSITKMFTATLIFQLVEAKKLSLATPLSTYFPQVPNAAQITIGNLLSHRSGIYNITDDPTYVEWHNKVHTKAEMLKIIAATKPSFPPDSTSGYSNSNYILLGYIVEAVAKKPYGKMLKEKITDKIGLKNTYYGTDKKDPHEALSYMYDEKWEQERVTDMSIPGGAGAIISDSKDLASFITQLFAGKLVSKESLEQMKTIRDGYGMGIFTFPFNDKKFYGHTGGIDAFVSVAGYNPQDSVAFVYCSNGTRYSRNDISIGVLSIYYNRPFTIPSFKTIKLKSEDLDKYLGFYENTQLHFAITITKDEDVLKAQATGQNAFPLEAVSENRFSFDGAGVVIDFKPGTSLVLTQNGRQMVFQKATDK